jgi:hypothetical protein
MGFVAEEMDFSETVVFDTVQSVGLVPTMRENIERDLAPNREGQPVVGKLLS